jgi:hypothetical protein
MFGEQTNPAIGLDISLLCLISSLLSDLVLYMVLDDYPRALLQ